MVWTGRIVKSARMHHTRVPASLLAALLYVSSRTSIRDAYPTRTKTLERAVPCMEIPGLHAVRQRADRSQAETDYGHNTRTYVGCAGILGFPGLWDIVRPRRLCAPGQDAISIKR